MNAALMASAEQQEKFVHGPLREFLVGVQYRIIALERANKSIKVKIRGLYGLRIFTFLPSTYSDMSDERMEEINAAGQLNLENQRWSLVRYGTNLRTYICMVHRPLEEVDQELLDHVSSLPFTEL